MLDEYRELCKQSADVVPGWKDMSKNDLCRAYVANKDNQILQNAYISAILYKYWNLISKYYYMSVNCATPEECYGWLVDSVACCVNLASWENPKSSIYNDPNGPDKVINRCMKCARLTYYQFINRKKRKDDFGLLSTDELRENCGDGVVEPRDFEQDYDSGEMIIRDYIVHEFHRKNYFVSFLLYYILRGDVFDTSINEDGSRTTQFNVRKICKALNNITENDLLGFTFYTDLPHENVLKSNEYIKLINPGNMRKKVLQAIETLKHSDLIKGFTGGLDAD